MTLNQYKATQKWNKDRGYTKFSIKLETDLLNEEKVEFYEAYHELLDVNPEVGSDKFVALVADMIDAICDVRFVAVGTEFKASLAMLEASDYVKLIALQSHVEKNLAIQEALLNEYVQVNLVDAYELVLQANLAKPAKTDANGKGIKGDDWIDPKIKIQELVKKSLG